MLLRARRRHRGLRARAGSCAGLRTLAAVGGFWGHQQIGDLLAYLRALANPLDELALYGGARLAARSGSRATALALLARAARARGRGAVGDALALLRAARALDELCAAPTGARCARFCARLGSERARAAARARSSELIERAVARERLPRARARRSTGASARLANVHKLLRLARALRSRRGPRPARLPRPRRPPAGGPRRARARGARRRRRARRGAADEHPRGQGPGVPGRVRRRPRPRSRDTRPPDLLVDGERIGLRCAPRRRREAAPALDYEELRAERRRRGGRGGGPRSSTSR